MCWFVSACRSLTAHRASALLEAESAAWIGKTVLLETEWVLRYTYAIPPARIHQAFCRLLALPQVIVEDAVAVSRSLEWYQTGLDFADALHLASGAVPRFVMFDQTLIRRARRLVTAIEVQSP